MTKSKRKRLIYNLVTFGLVIGAFIILENMIAAKAISRSLKGQLVPICAWIIMAVSLNLVIGFSGELSLGHAGLNIRVLQDLQRVGIKLVNEVDTFGAGGMLGSEETVIQTDLSLHRF